MTFPEFVFYALSAVMIFAALALITVRNPVHAALFLVLAFFNAAGIWILLEAEFLGIVLVLVYVGAVMVLFLFVVMMLDINLATLREGFMRFLPLGVLIAALMALQVVLVVGGKYFQVQPPTPAGADYSNTEALGRVLYTEYVYPFEIAAVILLVAIIAAITLTMRRRPGTKHQDPAQQVRVRKGDRLRVVKMPSEKR
jgi:NADH-quinone oxidoreductase subunit J